MTEKRKLARYCPWCRKRPAVYEPKRGWWDVICERDACPVTPSLRTWEQTRDEAVDAWNSMGRVKGRP